MKITKNIPNMTKKIKILTILCLITFIVNAQNVMDYTKTVYTGDSLRVDTFTIDISYLKDNSLLNASTANYLIEYKDIPSTINSANNRFALVQVFSSVAGWGTSQVNNLYVGNYSGSGLNENQINLFNLYYSDNSNKKDELEVRFRHELNGTMLSMVDSICLGYNIRNKKVAGTLVLYDQSKGIAVLRTKNSYSGFIVDYYTVTLATEEEIQKYY